MYIYETVIDKIFHPHQLPHPTETFLFLKKLSNYIKNVKRKGRFFFKSARDFYFENIELKKIIDQLQQRTSGNSEQSYNSEYIFELLKHIIDVTFSVSTNTELYTLTINALNETTNLLFDKPLLINTDLYTKTNIAFIKTCNDLIKTNKYLQDAYDTISKLRQEWLQQKNLYVLEI